MTTGTPRDTEETKCAFNPNEWSYLWQPRPAKHWKQTRCPKCGLWTVWRDLRFGTIVSQCDEREKASAGFNAVTKRALAERVIL